MAALVPVKVFQSKGEAELARDDLEAAGLTVVLVTQDRSLPHGAVELAVPEDQAARALHVLGGRAVPKAPVAAGLAAHLIADSASPGSAASRTSS